MHKKEEDEKLYDMVDLKYEDLNTPPLLSVLFEQ